MHKDFKMNKQTKYLLALGKFKSEENRAHYKRMMIDAQVTEERVQRNAQKAKDKDE
jgi:hypothetical protein